jgi:hypothetical protein
MTLSPPRPLRRLVLVGSILVLVACMRASAELPLGQMGVLLGFAGACGAVLWALRRYVDTSRELTRGRRAAAEGKTEEAQATLSRVAAQRTEPLTIAYAYGALSRIASEQGAFAEAARMADVGIDVARLTFFTTSRIPVEAELRAHGALARAAMGDVDGARALSTPPAGAPSSLPSAYVVRTQVLVAMKRNDSKAALDIVDAERPLLRNGLAAMDGDLVAALEALALTKVGDAYRGTHRAPFRVEVDDATRAYVTAVHPECAGVLA